ncbi:hypothetical protein [Paraoerskovia sediminicola]|nr:hypothetical protein [Paraoerskovia sediminicola]
MPMSSSSTSDEKLGPAWCLGTSSSTPPSSSRRKDLSWVTQKM